MVDPENSAFFPSYETGQPDYTTGLASRIEGIGRPRVEPSFVPTIVDRMIAVPDAASFAAMRFCSPVTGRRGGRFDRYQPVGRAPARPPRCARPGPRAASSRCSATAASGTRQTYYDDGWVESRGLDLAPYLDTLERFAATGEWREPPARADQP